MKSSRKQKVEQLRRLDLDAHLGDPAIKQRYVTTMFDVIAARYDRFTRIFSFGMDKGWKRELLDRLAVLTPPRPKVLDLACGTGDFAAAAAALRSGARVWGMDVSAEMLACARRRLASRNGARVGLCRADATVLPARDSSVDLVTVSYGMRNLPDCERGLAEIRRVLKPGGLFACLDFYKPAGRAWREIYLGYLSVAGSLYGLLEHGHAPVYGYIAESIRRHVTVEEFDALLERQGFSPELVRKKLGGGLCLHIARKGPRAGEA